MNRYFLFFTALLQLAGGVRAASVPSVDPTNRQAVKNLYLAYYAPPMPALGWTGNLSTLDPGTTSPVYRDYVNTRVNFYRSLVGVPSDIAFDDAKSHLAQAAAMVMSLNGALNHNPPSTWLGYSANAYAGASNSDLSLAGFGAEAIELYIQDAGSNNTFVGHRLDVFCPQTRVMGTGDVDETPSLVQAKGGLFGRAANALYTGGIVPSVVRPATRDTFIAWPHPGYNCNFLIKPYASTEALRWCFGYVIFTRGETARGSAACGG